MTSRERHDMIYIMLITVSSVILTWAVLSIIL